jgi:pilus assembly protein Flp/PilA
MRTLARFLRDQSAATSVEFGLIAVCISFAIVAVVHGVGGKLKVTFGAARADVQ